jgi:hypothetical protein
MSTNLTRRTTLVAVAGAPYLESLAGVYGAERIKNLTNTGA